MKTTKILKAILLGIVAGAAIFFIPFPFRFLLGFFLIFFIIRFFAFRRWRDGYGPHNFGRHYFWNPSYTQRWHSMSDEERKAFIKKMEAELFNTNVSPE